MNSRQFAPISTSGLRQKRLSLLLLQAVGKQDVDLIRRLMARGASAHAMVPIVALDAPINGVDWKRIMGAGKFKPMTRAAPTSIAVHIVRTVDDLNACKMLDMLIRHCKLSPNLMENGLSLLHIAALNKSPRCLEVLMLAGADPRVLSTIEAAAGPGKTAQALAKENANHLIAGMFDVWRAKQFTNLAIAAAMAPQLAPMVKSRP